MTARSSDSIDAANEKGFVLILAVFIFAALFAVVGLAVDAANLYRARLWLQKAADAGVIAGMGYAALRTEAELAADAATAGKSVKQLLEQKAREAAEANLRLTGFDLGAGNSLAYALQVQTNFQDRTALLPDTLTVDVQANVKYYLMHVTPFFLLGSGTTDNKQLVKTKAAGIRKEANIMLVLDNSDSMGCPATGSCDCHTVNRVAACAVPLRVEMLKDAVNSFVEYFDPTYDRIGVTSYNIAATVDVPINIARGFDKANLSAKVAALNPVSSTNLADGLIRSYLEISKLGAQAQKTYVVLSDGAPSATRVLLNNPTALAPWNPNGIGQYDYTHYTVHWLNDPTKTPSEYDGPSPLVQSGSISPGWTSTTPAAGVAACSTAAPPSSPADFNSVFSNCVADLTFRMPNSTASFGSALSPSFAEWRKLYYLNALQLTDFMRDNRGMLYFIGIGQPAPINADPFQGLDEVNSRKDVFCARAANDFLQGQVEAAHPEFAYSGYRSYAWWDAQADPHQGAYFWDINAANMETLFKKAALRIKMRLIQ